MNPFGPTQAAALLLAALLPLFATLHCEAQTVWRCGAQGNSYSQIPCADGQTVAVADNRTAQQVQDAKQVATAERRLADQLRAERLLREAPVAQPAVRKGRARNVTLQNSPAGPRPKPHPHRTQKPAAPETWQAIVPATRQRKG